MYIRAVKKTLLQIACPRDPLRTNLRRHLRTLTHLERHTQPSADNMPATRLYAGLLLAASPQDPYAELTQNLRKAYAQSIPICLLAEIASATYAQPYALRYAHLRTSSGTRVSKEKCHPKHKVLLRGFLTHPILWVTNRWCQTRV